MAISGILQPNTRFNLIISQWAMKIKQSKDKEIIYLSIIITYLINIFPDTVDFCQCDTGILSDVTKEEREKQ